MTALLWSAGSWAIGSAPNATIKNINFPVIARVYFEDRDQLQQFYAYSDVWSINHPQQFATVQVNDIETWQKLQQMDLTIRLDQKLMDQVAADQAKIRLHSPNGSGIPGYACCATLAENTQRINQMASSFPDLVEVIDIGDSWEKVQDGSQGEDLKVLRITNQNVIADKPVLFISSAIHAREYTTAELNTRFAEYLVSQYGVDADVTWILDYHEIHLSLHSNPDGRKRAETGILWRKNTNNNYCSDSNNRGIDLNRNYPYQWGIGGSSSACNETFFGPSEASESEIADQMFYLRQLFDDNRGPGDNDPAPADTAGIFIDIHSYSELILWPWGYTTNDTANVSQLEALGKRTAYFNQYNPIPVNELVITGGGSIDAIYGELGVASLAFELGTAFFQDCATFENEIFPDNLAALLYLARVTQAPYIQPSGPDIESLYVVPNVITANTTIQITGTANDDRYNQSNGGISSGQVQSVSAYLNELPINATGNGQALSPADGNFNQVSESFSGTLITNTLPAGKSMLYVQAHDGTQPGGTYAKFIDVVEPADVAELHGTVIDALTGLPVSQALLDINGSQAITANNGSYQQWVQPGTADLLVTATNYLPYQLSDLNLMANNSQTQNIALQPFCVLFNDDMETGINGWTIESPWALSNELSFSPSQAWSDSPGGNYTNNSNVALTSPSITVSGTEHLEVSYQHLCDTEASYDFGYFEISFDGGNWQTLSQCDNQSNWQLASHSIAVPQNANDMHLRFRLQSDAIITRDGWHIDDVVVKGAGAVCANFLNDVIFIDDFE